MEELFAIAMNPDIDLQTRYDAARLMQYTRKTDPKDYIETHKQNVWRSKTRPSRAKG